MHENEVVPHNFMVGNLFLAFGWKYTYLLFIKQESISSLFFFSSSKSPEPLELYDLAFLNLCKQVV